MPAPGGAMSFYRAGVGRNHWAFKPVQKPAVPAVQNSAWAKNPVDQFILAKLEASGLTPNAPAAKATPPTPFDVGKFAGIFAAIGLAVGALGTAAASMVTGLLALKWWQMPLALAGLVLVISGPSMLVAWFKLRSRVLGPLLDANGWAVNARARINIPFGTALTQMPTLPNDAERSLTDPYGEREHPWTWYAAIGTLIFVLLALWSR